MISIQVQVKAKLLTVLNSYYNISRTCMLQRDTLNQITARLPTVLHPVHYSRFVAEQHNVCSILGASMARIRQCSFFLSVSVSFGQCRFCFKALLEEGKTKFIYDIFSVSNCSPKLNFIYLVHLALIIQETYTDFDKLCSSAFQIKRPFCSKCWPCAKQAKW